MLKQFIAAAMLSAVIPAHAEILIFDFTGVISDVIEVRKTPNGTRDKYVVSSTILPGGVAIGDTFSGRLVYDTAAPIAQFTTPSATQAIYQAPAFGFPPSHVTFDKSGLRVESPGGPSLAVSNYLSDDVFPDSFAASYNSVHGTAYSNVSVSLYDDTATVFDNTAIPTSLLLGAYTNPAMYLYWTDPSLGQRVLTNSVLTSLTLVSSVPEPSGYAMLLAGMALVGVAIRRRAR